MKVPGRIKKYFKRLQLIKCWGSFRRLKPFSSCMGYDRGNQSIARYYVDAFMAANAVIIKGKVLEIGDNTYTTRHGQNIELSDVLHVIPGNPLATIVADMTKKNDLKTDSYDCVIMPQTLPFIYEYKAALKDAYRILKPGGVLLVTLSGISQISRYDMDRWGDYWRFTSLSAKMDFESIFPSSQVEVKSYGNVLSATAFLQGLASNELRKRELNFQDPDYEVIITVKAIK